MLSVRPRPFIRLPESLSTVVVQRSADLDAKLRGLARLSGHVGLRERLKPRSLAGGAGGLAVAETALAASAYHTLAIWPHLASIRSPEEALVDTAVAGFVGAVGAMGGLELAGRLRRAGAGTAAPRFARGDAAGAAEVAYALRNGAFRPLDARSASERVDRLLTSDPAEVAYYEFRDTRDRIMPVYAEPGSNGQLIAVLDLPDGKVAFYAAPKGAVLSPPAAAARPRHKPAPALSRDTFTPSPGRAPLRLAAGGDGPLLPDLFSGAGVDASTPASLVEELPPAQPAQALRSRPAALLQTEPPAPGPSDLPDLFSSPAPGDDPGAAAVAAAPLPASAPSFRPARRLPIVLPDPP